MSKTYIITNVADDGTITAKPTDNSPILELPRLLRLHESPPKLYAEPGQVIAAQLIGMEAPERVYHVVLRRRNSPIITQTSTPPEQVSQYITAHSIYRPSGEDVQSWPETAWELDVVADDPDQAETVAREAAQRSGHNID